MTRFVSIDPGARHVGLAFWSAGRLEDAYECRPEDVGRILHQFSPTVIVLESFVVYAHKAKTQTHSKMETPQLIGQIKTEADRLGARVVEQGASLRKVAERSPWGKRMAERQSRGNRHVWDAICHGLYYIHFNKKNPANQRKRT